MIDRRMTWVPPTLLVLCLAGLVPGTVKAQSSSAQDDTVYEDEYDNEDQYEDNRYAFGIGAGIVLPNDEGRDNGEIYYSANFRWRIFDRNHRDYDKNDKSGDAYNARHNRHHDRGRYPGERGDSGIRGYIEPEVGYWKRSDKDAGEAEDLHLGINLVGVVPTRSADFFVGVGFGYHLLDGEVLRRNSAGTIVQIVDASDDRLGANLQVGVELHVSESFGVFGAGRLDILEDEPFDRQTKIWGGLRWHF